MILLLACVVIAVFTFQYYGASWDEGSQRFIGETNWNYFAKGDRLLFTYYDADHGAGFELLLIIFEKGLGLKDLHDIYLMRHLVTHLFFLLGAFFCYKLTDLLYTNKFLSVLSFLLFVMHPVIYGHSFFNTKDLPFLSLFMICFYLVCKLFQKKTLSTSLLLGMCLGILINIRMMGLLLLGVVLFFLMLDAVREKRYADNFKYFSVVLVASALSLYGTWPYLWEHPFHNFFEVLKNMSQFRWEETNLYDGKNVPGDKIGWEYIPLWFSVTTPLPYLLAGVFGIALFIKRCIKNPSFIFELKGKLNSIFLICFFVPVFAIIVLHSIVYDGWRHLFFIYPSFCMLLIFGIDTLVTNYKRWIVAGSIVSFVFVAAFMISNFPFGHVYFNLLVSFHSEPEYIRKHYDMDYWGTAYKQSLEYILEHDSSPVITVFPENYPGILNANILPEEQRKRILIVPTLEEATYYVTNYRWHLKDYPFENKKVHAIKVLNSSINAVYKLR